MRWNYLSQLRVRWNYLSILQTSIAALKAWRPHPRHCPLAAVHTSLVRWSNRRLRWWGWDHSTALQDAQYPRLYNFGKNACINTYKMLLVGLRAAISHLTWKEQIRPFDVELGNCCANRGGWWSGVGLSEVRWWDPWWLPPPTVDETLNGIILSAGLQHWWCSQHVCYGQAISSHTL